MVMLTKSILFSVFAAQTCLAQNDYLDELPLTVYENPEPSPQTGVYDPVGNQFFVHPGWYNDVLVHYYVFRLFDPDSYSNISAEAPNSNQVPLQRVFVVTTTGDLSGAVGMPIIESHTADGELYSDFVEINYVAAPEGYDEDSFRSVGDITDSRAAITPSGIVCNLPVVPTDATLQRPGAENTTEAAPIDPVLVWYRGLTVWTYVMEVTDQAAADYFSFTREDPEDPAFAITVQKFATPSSVFAIPFWFQNHLMNGVTQFENSGGPINTGMRNIVNLDRGDPGYSPLWNLWFLTETPTNYIADQVSNSSLLTSANGFQLFRSPIFGNCPNIGALGTEKNMNVVTFQLNIDASAPSSIIQGLEPSLLFTPGMEVVLAVDGATIDTTKTTGGGGFEFDLLSSTIPAGATSLDVVVNNETIRTIEIANAPTIEGANTAAMLSGASAPLGVMVPIFAAVVFAVI